MRTKEEILDALCDHFDDELVRQETMLAICISQGEAARAHDFEHLEAKTASMQALQREAIEAEEERLSLVCQVVDAFDLPVEKQNLSDLIVAVPEPWKTRLREFQLRMAEVITEVRSTSRENNALMRRSLRVVNDALNTVLRFNPAANGHYDAAGQTGRAAGSSPAVMDRRG